ncbi:type I polyketide synthase [Lawsonella clevelandensis]|uniref:type I polyketide synthase n=1 Tax=Lawsonella clevelandensis TaxID=1528099 RepID=UPI0023F32817|nr:type I polyketide synthase [Lawsonella clevelandensis]
MKSDLTVVELIAWMREWIANDVSITVSEVNPDQPFEEFGLSSRSILELAGQLENLTGKSINAAVVYQNPTVNKLAVFLLDDSDPAAETHQKVRDRSTVEGADIAIIGVATRFPGDANTPEQYWTLLHDGVDAVTDLPADRYQEFLEDKEVDARVTAAPTRGGFITSEYIRYFDPEFFSISPREAEQVDPQQRMLLELTYEVFEDAHLPISEQRGHKVGVFIGASNQDYARILESDYSAFHPYSLTGLSPSILANRVSYTFDFRGPSISMDTACSSSLVAVHQAVQALRRGESSLAVAGGINLILAPGTQLAFADLETVLSPDGYIKAFSNDADGISRSDGAGLVLLKRLQDAEADGDHIYAVIKGSAVNQDGRSNGITAPNPDAQMEVLVDAYHDANIVPQDVDYVEAHGTGTILGDPIEALALGKVLGYGRDEEKPLLLGSCKTNFGHMESAAGSASLIKLALAMEKGVIPPMLHFAGPNPYINFEGDHLEPVTENREWPRYSGKAVAGVSGFGFGGTNAHIVVEEYTGPASPAAVESDESAAADATDTDAPAAADLPALSDAERAQLEAENAMFEELEEPRTYVLPVSGTLATRARQTAKHVADWLEDNRDVDLAAVAHTLSTRSIGRFRKEVVATDVDSAIAGLLAIAEGTESSDVYSGHHVALEGPVWVYSGFGGQHRKMGKRLYLADKFRGDFGGIFAASFDNVAALIKEESGHDIREIMLTDALNWDTETAQDGIFAIQVALTDTLTYFGCQPAAVIGHSMGEVAAAYAAGGLSLNDAVRVICVRSRLLGEGEATLSEDEQGGMALVEYSAEEIAQLVADNPGTFDTVEPAVYAAPTQITVGGKKPDVQAFVDYATENGKFARMLNVNGAGHTSMVAPLIGELIGEIADIEPLPLHCTLFSSIDKEAVYQVGDTPTTYKYFAKGMRHSVWFTQAVSQACQAGHTCFMEVSAHPVAILSVAAATYAANIPNAKLFYTLRRKEYEPNTLVRAIAQLAAAGHHANLRNLALTQEYADVPRTAFQRKYCWTSARLSGANDSHLPGAHVLLPTGQHVWKAQHKAVKQLEMLAQSAAEYCFGEEGVVTSWQLDGEDVPDARYITMLNPQEGGATVEIFTQLHGESRPLASATITVGDPNAVSAIVIAKPDADEFGPEDPLAENNTDNEFYDPTTGETVVERLTKIVATNLAYNPEDLTSELPLMELGLDSLMAIRIKNRIQYEFQIPELDLMVVRSSTIGDVAEYISNVRDAQSQGLSGEEASKVSAQKLAEKKADENAAGTPGDGAGADVPPRDASERLAFSTWATVTGESAGDVMRPLPPISDDTRVKLAERLAERTGSDIDPVLLQDVKNIEQLANIIRPFLEKEVEGLVRTLRDFPEGQQSKALFLFHPAGGTTAQYSALVDDLPADIPVFGLERVEGPLEERAAEYLPAIKEVQPEGPYTLGGWSLGGALAYEVAKQLIAAGDEVAAILLIDTVQPSEPDPGTREELHARWDRYASFIQKTYGVNFQVPHDILDAQGEDGMMKLFAQMAATADLSNTGVSAAVLEHQRASFVDNRMLANLDMETWASVQVPVTLYRAERMHDGAIELEPRYATIDPDGGWGKIVKDLTVVPLKGDHLSVIDEPEVGKIARNITERRESLGL